MTGLMPVVRRAFRDHRHEAGAATAGVILVLLATGLVLSRRSAPSWPSAVAFRGDFRETLVETGTVNALRLMLYSSTIAGAQAKIVEIVAEGSSVKAGDRLVRFDASGFEQTLARERAALAQAQAELAHAREERHLEELRSKGDVDSARQQLGSAESNLTNQLEGRGKLEVAEAEATLAEAIREMGRAQTAYDDMKPLLAEGFVTRAELERAEQAWRRAEDQRRIAQARRDTLVRYERPAATSRSQAEVNLARDGLARQSETVAARLAERQASVALADGRIGEISARINILTRQIEQSTIRASGPGLVVYRELFFGGDRRKPQVGDEVWPNQPLIALPDASQLIVDTRVREIDLHKIAASQRVSVGIDAYPSVRLPASVSLVGALAQEDAARAGTKFFPVTVKLLAADARLRTGMTAQVEIETALVPGALLVPVEAVFDGDHGAKYVVVARGETTTRRQVTLAGTNDTYAAIADGVAEGERVLLVDPTRPAGRP